MTKKSNNNCCCKSSCSTKPSCNNIKVYGEKYNTETQVIDLATEDTLNN